MSQPKNIHAGHRERMRKRFLSTSGNGFSPHELLEMLLYYTIPVKNTNTIAHLLLEGYSSLREMFQFCTYNDFIRINNIGEKSAIFLSLIAAAYQSEGELRTSKKIFLNSSSDRCQFFLDKMQGKSVHKEIFMAMCGFMPENL